MNQITRVFIVLFLCLLVNPVRSVKNQKNHDMFKNTNRKLHLNLIRLFSALKLGETYVSNDTIQSVIKYKKNLKAISKIGDKHLRNIKAITRVNKTSYTEPFNFQIDINELAKEVIKEELTPDIKKENDQINRRRMNSNIQLIGNDSNESWQDLSFFKDLVKKIHGLRLKDVVVMSSSEEDHENILGQTSPTSNEMKPVYNITDYWTPISDTQTKVKQLALKTRRIFDGKRVRVKYYPFVVSISVMGIFSCSGSIVGKNNVITAASCLQLMHNNRFFRENPRSITVRLGANYVDFGGEEVGVTEVHFHPQYDPKTLNHNLAILSLEKRIKFKTKNKKVKKVMMDKSDSQLAFNTDGITLLGWGAKNPENILHLRQQLTMIVLDFYPLPECAKIYSSKYVTNKNFCGGFFSKGGGACNRDVGGPGIVNGLLVGVVSFGPAVCGTPDAPTVFTKIGPYADWIEQIMEAKVPTKVIRYDETYRTRRTVYTWPTTVKTTLGRVQPVLFSSTKNPLTTTPGPGRSLSKKENEYQKEEKFLKNILKKLVDDFDLDNVLRKDKTNIIKKNTTLLFKDSNIRPKMVTARDNRAHKFPYATSKVVKQLSKSLKYSSGLKNVVKSNVQKSKKIATQKKVVKTTPTQEVTIRGDFEIDIENADDLTLLREIDKLAKYNDAQEMLESTKKNPNNFKNDKETMNYGYNSNYCKKYPQSPNCKMIMSIKPPQKQFINSKYVKNQDVNKKPLRYSSKVTAKTKSTNKINCRENYCLKEFIGKGNKDDIVTPLTYEDIYKTGDLYEDAYNEESDADYNYSAYNDEADNNPDDYEDQELNDVDARRRMINMKYKRGNVTKGIILPKKRTDASQLRIPK